MTRKLSLLLTMVFALPHAASAQEHRLASMAAGRFGQICSKPRGKAICDAYISGMSDSAALSALHAQSHGDTNPVAAFCVPDAESTTHMRLKVLSWLRSHRDVLQAPVGKSVFAALHDAYPCPEAQSRKP